MYDLGFCFVSSFGSRGLGRLNSCFIIQIPLQPSSLLLKILGCGASKVFQEVKVSVVKFDNLNPIPGMHTREGEN